MKETLHEKHSKPLLKSKKSVHSKSRRGRHVDNTSGNPPGQRRTSSSRRILSAAQRRMKKGFTPLGESRKQQGCMQKKREKQDNTGEGKRI